MNEAKCRYSLKTKSILDSNNKRVVFQQEIIGQRAVYGPKFILTALQYFLAPHPSYSLAAVFAKPCFTCSDTKCMVRLWEEPK